MREDRRLRTSDPSPAKLSRRSFVKAGFFDHAIECARLGVAAASKEAQGRGVRAQKMREAIAELDRLIARAEAERKALEANAAG